MGYDANGTPRSSGMDRSIRPSSLSPSSSSSSIPKDRSIIGRIKECFPPLNGKTLLTHYMPASGAVSHALFQNHIFSPNIIHRLFPVGELAVSNVILFNANLGLGFWVYFRPHLSRADRWTRVEFAVFASTIFNFGSLLASVLIKALLPTKTATPIKSLLATSLSFLLLSRAYKYSKFVDKRRVAYSKSPSPKLSNGHATSINGDSH